MSSASVQVDANLARAFLHMRKGETLDQFRDPAELVGAPVPVFVCLNCATIYEDAEATKVIHDDGRPSLAECPCKAIALVDVRSVKVDFELQCCTTCGAVFEKADPASTLIRSGVALATPCVHGAFKMFNARENGIAYFEEAGKFGAVLKSGVAPVPMHVVRAKRIETETEQEAA